MNSTANRPMHCSPFRKADTRFGRPRPREDSADWSERAAYLPMEGTAEPGRYSLDKTPWVREILQTLDNPHVRLVAFQSSRQVGKTTSGQMWFGRTVCHDASPFLLVQADGQVIKKFVRERIWPFIDATPELRELKDTNRDNWNLEDMHFDSGMWLNCVGARSIMGLSQRAIKRIWFEECNKYKTEIGRASCRERV